MVLARGFGVANVETGAPVTPDMLFRLGSTTKMFTAAAVVSLAVEGKLRLDEPIGAHIPGLHSTLARVTAHQLLTHSAGLRDEAPMFGRHDEEALGENVRAMQPDMFFTDPARVFSYSNPGFWIAGFLAEAVAGRPYADVLAERLFKPLDMERTTLRPTEAMTYPLAQGHEVGQDGRPVIIRPAANNTATWPAGSIFSNVLDLARFVQAFMNGGRLDGRQVIAPAIIAKLSEAHIETPSEDGARYGYGLNVGTVRGVRILQHGGSRAGYGSTIRMAPDQRVAVIILGNRSGSGLPRTADAALELLLPFGPAHEARGSPVPLTDVEMRKYVGTYSQGNQAVEVVIERGQLAVNTGTARLALVNLGEHRFRGEGPDGPPQTLVFVMGEDGRAEYLYRGTRALRRQ
ncbi:MAG: beta-lactamase family protein [Gemmatimonadetes bacterium]|nr:beta-lactamase family protein [Gemmatimonadota bacterium]